MPPRALPRIDATGTGLDPMNAVVKSLLILILIAVGGGIAFLAAWDIPPPTHPVEQIIPNDRFAR